MKLIYHKPPEKLAEADRPRSNLSPFGEIFIAASSSVVDFPAPAFEGWNREKSRPL
jgi:hypothetical protein